MAVTTAEAMRFENAATQDELDAYRAAYEAVQTQALNPACYRDLFLVAIHTHPRPVPAVATIGVNDDGSQALDGLWIYLPGRNAIWVGRGDAFERVAAAMRAEHVAEREAA